jgi:hypothetical protein
MTRTARAPLTSSLVVLLALCATAFAAVPDGPPPDVVKPSERPRLAGPDGNAAMWALAEMLQPVILAALCAGALALFSARPKASIRVRARRRK